MEDYEITTMSAGDDDELSKEQLIALSVLQISSAFLSVIGSSTIVITLLRDLAQNRSRYMMPYDRIMLSLSTCDILASITFAINQFLLPSESGAIWAFGTPETCRQAGFLTQLFPFWAIWYNCILSYYFLLRILAQRKQQKFNPKYEFWMHITGLYFPITAILGYFRGWYSVAKVGSSCWISDPLLKWIVAGIPTLFTYFSLIANNIVIYVVLRRSLRSSEPEQKRLLNEATTLMFLYVGCFFVTISPGFVLEILEAYFGYGNHNANKIYYLYVLNAMLKPLQGFFNVFIYRKPAYTRFRASHPDKPVYFVLHQALFNPKIPKLTSLSNDPSTWEISISAQPIEGDAKEENPDRNSKRRPSKMPAVSEDAECIWDSTAEPNE